jgi:hypothetical protein
MLSASLPAAGIPYRFNLIFLHGLRDAPNLFLGKTMLRTLDWSRSMKELREMIANFSDKDLLIHVVEKAGEYTPEALSIMKEEMARRKIDASLLSKDDSDANTDEPQITKFKSEDFVEFEHSFSRTDLPLAAAMLRDHGIPFFVDNPTSSDTIPIENELEKRFIIRIPKAYIDKAHEQLDEHFIKADNKYLLKYSGARDRLRAFNFHDIHLTETESLEELEVALAAEEKRCVIDLGRRLLDEADSVEQTQERVLFYYDSIEPLITRLEEHDSGSLSRTDLLTMLEILQVYIDDPAFPASMDEAVSTLLGFFIG